jgi:hypothetical protein
MISSPEKAGNFPQPQIGHRHKVSLLRKSQPPPIAMDNALDQITDKCFNYLQAYRTPPSHSTLTIGTCVAANRHDYGVKCETERIALTDCAENKYFRPEGRF